MGKTRVEEDSFGKVELPAEVLYGIHTARTLENLSFSNKRLHEYPDYVHALLTVKKAAALTNVEAGVIPKEMGDSISNACDQLQSTAYQHHFLIDVLHGGGGIGTNMNVNEVIAGLINQQCPHHLPIHPIEHVNASQSTSDVCHTAIRIAIIKSYHYLEKEMEHLHSILQKKMEEFQPVVTIARTCLQDAMSISLSDIFSGYEAVLSRRTRYLKRAVEELHAVNLGGTVIGSGIGASGIYRSKIVQQLSRLSGMQLYHRANLFDAAQNIDDLADVSNELKQLATSFIKFAKDLRLLSSGPEAGFGEIQLPSVQAGSSFFPGKVNPVVPETLIQCCFQVLGCDRIVQAAFEHGELNLNVFEGAAGINILDSIQFLTSAVRSFSTLCVQDLSANSERCQQLSQSRIPLIVEMKEKYGYSRVAGSLKEAGYEGLKKWRECEYDKTK
ncbi:lyase family protein [Priestia megaterium]|uniref:lyase family protein n=1 Tax=Priestia megaterium TaxID=1404 RepID=UPI00296FA27B|nr:lyase family protein [Priestia megaterium]MDW4510010.1 lyase family protein [Priestia megaterium]